MKKVFLILIVLLTAIAVSWGCSPYRAANQPREKNLSVLEVGTHRDLVIAELGTPAVSGKDERGAIYDVFVFIDGYSTAARTARAIFHGAADVVTLGLWELLATPIEGANSGSRMKVRVEYSSKNTVSKTEILEPKPEKTAVQETPKD